MRRFIAYITMALTMLLSIGVAATPVFTMMNPGREFTNGNEIVYRLSEKDENQSLENDADAALKVAEEMTARLENYKIEDYSVRVDGNDTVRVSLGINDDTELTYISRYLSFNGGNFSLATKEEETRLTADKIFVDSKAYIVHVQDLVPYVIFPVSDPSLVKTLIESLNKSEDTSASSLAHIKKANEDGSEENSEPDVFLWANWEEGDSYEIAQEDPAVTGQKIICSFLSSNIWYEDSAEEQTELQFLCGYANSDGEYDTTKLKQANQLATFVCNMFNASSFEYNVETLFVNETSSGVTNNYIRTDATAENLIIFGNDINLAISVTLIATIVAICVMFLILVLLYRVGSLAIISNSLANIFLSYVLFMLLGATFNIAAIVGGILIAGMSITISALYMNKLKEEVYKGRALRKANQEAMKKITLPTIDFAVIYAFSGLMLYFLGGNALKPLGIMLFFGAFVTLILTMTLFRLSTWLMTNSTKISSKLSLINIDEKLVPNIMQEEKPTYVNPYENKDFTKKRKPVMIVSLILAIASIATISVFGTLKGSPLNVSNATKETTQIYLSIQKDNPTISTEEEFKNEILANVLLNGKPLEYQNVEVIESNKYDYQTKITTKYTYFLTTIDNTFSANDKFEYVIGDVTNEAIENGLEEAISSLVTDKEGTSSSDYIVSEVKQSKEIVVTPNQGFVALACAISILGSCLYIGFRYRPSRALASLFVTSIVTLISYGFFVMTRIQTTGITSLIMPIATIITLTLSILYFEKEKEMLKEEKGVIEDEKRSDIMKKAISYSFIPMSQTALLVAFLSIDYFGFGSKNFAAIFAGMLLAIALSVLLITSILGPTSEFISRKLKKIHLPTIKIKHNKKSKIKLQNKQKSSEPEETIFIGIND